MRMVFVWARAEGTDQTSDAMTATNAANEISLRMKTPPALAGSQHDDLDVGDLPSVARVQVLRTRGHRDQAVLLRLQLEEVAGPREGLVGLQFEVRADDGPLEDVERVRDQPFDDSMRREHLAQDAEAAGMRRLEPKAHAVVVSAARGEQEVVLADRILGDAEQRPAPGGVENPAGGDLERPVQLSRVGLGESLGRLARDERDQIADLLALDIDDAEALARTHLDGGTGARLHEHLARAVRHRATPRMRSKVRTNASIAVT